MFGEVIQFVALDFETTGLSPEIDRIVEVGAVRFNASGTELGRFERLVDPGCPMPKAAQRIHGLCDADLAGQPLAAEVLPEFLTWLGEPIASLLLAHNASFDAGFLGRELARLGRDLPSFRIADTLALARRRLPGAPNHRLDTLALLLKLDQCGAHRALADSVRVKGLWLALGGTCDGVVCYPVYDPATSPAVPEGWGPMAEAVASGLRIRMEYAGGTRGDVPREITPRRFVQKGGVAYVLALCHLDDQEKSFRLDRVRHYEIVRPGTNFDPPDQRC
jgi:DNA polymerase III subunit epsilon